MGNYRVHWEIDVEDAPTPQAAARSALDAILRPGSIAHVFDVHDRDGTDRSISVDLDAIAGDPEAEPPARRREPSAEVGP